MAEESIVIDVKVNTSELQKQMSASIHAVAQLKAERAYLTKEIEKGNDVDGQYALQLSEINKRLEKHQRNIKSTTALMQVEGKTRVEANMSLDEQRQILNTLQKAYANLSGEAKEMADEEGGLRDQIKAVRDALYEQEHAIGDDRRNVGNYAESLSGLSSQLGETKNLLDASAGAMEQFGAAGKLVGSSLKGLGKLVDFASKSTNSFAKSQNTAKVATQGATAATTAESVATDGATASQMGLNAAIAANPIGAMITALTIAVALLSEFAMAEDDAAVGAEHIRTNYEKLGDYLERFSQFRSLEIDKLRLQGATEEDIYRENVSMLNETIQLREKLYNDALAERRKYQQGTEEYVTWDKNVSDALYAWEKAQLEKDKVIAAERKRLDDERIAEEKRVAQEEEKAKEEARKRAEERAKQIEAQNRVLLEIERKSIDLTTSLIEDENARKIAARRVAGEREIEDLKIQLKKGENLTKEAREKLNQLIIAKQDALDKEIAKMSDDFAKEEAKREEEATRERANRILALKIELAEGDNEKLLPLKLEELQRQLDAELEAVELTEEEKQLIREKYAKMAADIQMSLTKTVIDDTQKTREAYATAYQSIASTASSVFKSLRDMADLDAETSESNARAKKGFAIAGILSDQAGAIATSVKATMNAIEGATKAAAETGIAAPFTTPIFISEMVGIVGGAIAAAMTGIAEAKKVMAGKFEDGGIVPGNSYSGDHMIARVNSGEAIITREGQARLLELAENPMSGSNAEAMANLFASAVASLPAPVMVYEEFQNFQDRTATYNEIARL